MDDNDDFSHYDRFNKTTDKIKIYTDFESNDDYTENFKSEEENLILNKINLLQKKILNFMNITLNINLTGNETKLDLSYKNIDDKTLNLFTGLKLENIEELNLSHNNISNVKILKNLNLKKLKKLELSFNKINKIKDPVKNINKIFNNKKIEINLDKNNLIQKDIKEIQDFIMNDETKKNNLSEYEYLSIDDMKKQKIEKLLSKLKSLEQKVLSYFNLTGKEIYINLRNSNFNDNKLELLSGVEFKNLEELNLSHNKITNILPIKNFKTLKKLNISFNKINDLKPLEEISKNNKDIKEINLRNNEIRDVEILKLDIFPYISKINLENNKNLIQKDIDEIINIIKQRKKLCHDNKDDFRNYYEIIEEIRTKKFEVIYKAKEKKSGELRTIKLLEKSKIIKCLNESYKNSLSDEEKKSFIEPDIEGWLEGINNMKILENNNMDKYLVKIYDYFDTEEELAIVMELYDEDWSMFISKRKFGFEPKEIKKIFSILNNIFKISYKKIYYPLYNNIFIKYLDKNKTKFLVKFKFSDNVRAINPKTFNTIIYTSSYYNSCGLFQNEYFMKGFVFKKDVLLSLGSIIYKFIFKEYPYKDNDNNSNNINLKKTSNKDLNDLLSKLLEKKDISWEEYFIHPFFEKN